MTTIAYRDGVLAADTAATAGGSMIGRVTKIAHGVAGSLVAAAGDASYNAAFLAWAKDENGPAPEAKETQDSFDRGVIFRPDGNIEVYEPRGRFVMTSAYYALGSGRPEALGAMFMGASPEMAVRAAMAHDPHTAGDITVLKGWETGLIEALKIAS